MTLPAEQDGMAPPAREAPLRLLLIHDASAASERSLAMLELELPHAQVHVGSSVDAAMAHLGQHEVDVVVADLSRPETQGDPIVRAMRARHPETALMAITGREDGALALWVLAEGRQGPQLEDGNDESRVADAVLRAIQRRRVETELDSHHGLARALLDASGDPICAVDSESRIVAVNQAWRDFAGLSGGPAELSALGVSYLDTCDRAAADADRVGDPATAVIADGLRQVLAGTLTHFRHDYPCQSLGENRWFSGRIAPAVIGGGPGAVISHVDITPLRTMQRSLAHQSLHDPLTDLPNRDLMLDRLGQAVSDAKRGGRRIAVTNLALHRYQQVNDRVGYRGGDAVLVQVAERLRAQLRPGDTLSRFAGDKFLVLWGGLDEGRPDDALELSRALVHCLDRPFEVAAAQVPVSASAGACVHTPGQSVDELLRAAESAMLDATGRGPGHVVLFTDELREATTFRRSLEADLVVALEEPVTQLVLHYQPVVDLASGRVEAVEALVRWQHPQWGLLGPDRFIPLAEASGLIQQLGEWVLCRALRDAPALTYEGRELDVAVNVSVRQLDDRAVTKVRDALEASSVRPERLIVEVTESAIVNDVETTAATLAGLSRLGVRIAIDDFGTGYSSLLYLRRYPVDILKIDVEFVAGIGKSADDEAICSSIASLAGAVGASTVGEGVETMEQYAFLRSLGCRQGQGFLWSPAVPVDKFQAALVSCGEVPVAAPRPPAVVAPRPLEPEVTALIAKMHSDGAPLHTAATALNRTIGRHPTGVPWTAGAVARALPAAEAPSRSSGLGSAGMVLLCIDVGPARRMLSVDLEVAGFEVVEARDGHEAMGRLIASDAPPLDVIVLDLQPGPYDAPWAIAAIRSHHRLDDVPVVLVAPVDATSPGTGDPRYDEVVSRPLDAAELVETVSRLARAGRSQARRAAGGG